MNYLKFTQYVYLVFAGFFVYDGATKINTEESPWLSFLIAGLAVFMFFFRRRFAHKFEQRKPQNPNSKDGGTNA